MKAQGRATCRPSPVCWGMALMPAAAFGGLTACLPPATRSALLSHPAFFAALPLALLAHAWLLALRVEVLEQGLVFADLRRSRLVLWGDVEDWCVLRETVALQWWGSYQVEALEVHTATATHRLSYLLFTRVDDVRAALEANARS